MGWIAGGLAVVIAVVFGGLYLLPDSTSTPSGSEGAEPVAFDQALAGQGKDVAASNGCTSCHSIDGSDGVGPSWKGIYGTEVDIGTGKVKVNAAYIETAIVDPNAEVNAGYGPSMPSFEGKLSDEEITAIVEYIKSLNG
jgi:cytochrome c oxidase subunit 2